MNNIKAALIFFTRLPFWRLWQVSPEYYKNVVVYWPFVGWLSGAVMAAVFFGASFILPPVCAAILALTARLLVTGALHEDGFADFFDGFGGGTTRERILEIMKDSHIGTYGVIALIVYYLLIVNVVASVPVLTACAALVACDSWSKFCASNIVNVLPYARKESESKSHTVYNRKTVGQNIAGFIGGALPVAFLPPMLMLSAVLPALVAPVLFSVMRRKINGYTGDCCGASFIICELSMWLGLAAIVHSGL